jgi:hypothetical protein
MTALPKAENPQRAGSQLIGNRLVGEGAPGRSGLDDTALVIALA